MDTLIKNLNVHRKYLHDLLQIKALYLNFMKKNIIFSQLEFSQVNKIIEYEWFLKQT